MDSIIARSAHRYMKAWMIALLATLGLAGCATPTTPDVVAPAQDTQMWDGSAPEALIATELVSVLMQLPDHSPWSTTLSLSKPATSFGVSLENVLRISGYGIQRVSADQGAKYVAYSKSKIASNDAITTNYSMTIGRLTISRDYEVIENQVFPTSLITVVGMLPKNITLNDDLYRQRGGNRTIPNGVVFKSLDGRTLDTKQSNVVVNSRSERTPDEQVSHQRFLALSKSRLYLDSKLSEPVDVRNWEPVRQVLLVFPTPDNLVLGPQNKAAIETLITFYNPDTTGFEITGCKSNSSLLWDGTENDSLERQLRVRNELLVAGIDIARIRENGCSANEFDVMLKKYSVLLTLRERR